MLIIAFEGLDKSGKKTASDLLCQALYEQGFNVERGEFHNYSSPTGQLVRQFLNGEYNPGQLAIEAIMAADKYAQLEWIKEIAEQTDVLILDRYLMSQLVYGDANGTDIDWLCNLLQYMPIPDFQFYLDIEPAVSMERKGEHGDNDKYESNKELLYQARLRYLRYFRIEEEANQAMILDGTQTPMEIHEQILERTLSLLNKSKGETTNESNH